MDTGMILFAFRYALIKKGMVLTKVTNFVTDHIEELPNDLLMEMESELNLAYDNMTATKIPGYLSAKRLVTTIRREVYNEE